jgi:hypothetical protein
MSKEDINMEEVYVFPHVRYVPLDDNPNPLYVYKKYIGKHTKEFSHGKVYQFYQALFSPNRETPRKKVWITKTDIGPYVRYEDTINQWEN